MSESQTLPVSKLTTEEQKAMIPVFVEKWATMAVGKNGERRNTRKVSPATANAVAAWLYTTIDLPMPKATLRLNSPHAMQVAACMLRSINWDCLLLGGVADYTVAEFVIPKCPLHLSPVTLSTLCEEMATALLDFYVLRGVDTDSEWCVHAAKNAFKSFKCEYVETAGVGLGSSGEDNGICQYDFCKFCMDEQIEINNLHLFACEQGIWDCIMLHDVFLTCEAPCEVHFDSDRKMHNENGPALCWEDGHSLNFIHGE